MAIKQWVTYEFVCDLCGFRAYAVSAMSQALLRQDEHEREAHPSYFAERQAAREGAGDAE